jgi:hypothetical protein
MSIGESNEKELGHQKPISDELINTENFFEEESRMTRGKR